MSKYLQKCWQRYFKQPWFGKVFIITAIGQTIVFDCLAIANLADNYAKNNTGNNCGANPVVSSTTGDCHTDSWYESSLVLFMIVSIWMVHFAVDGILFSNLSELSAFFCSTGLLFSFSIFKFVNFSSLSIYSHISIWITITTQILYWVLLRPIYKEISWKVYKKIGSDPEFIKIYRRMQQCKSLLKLDMLAGLVLFFASGIFASFDWKDLLIGIGLLLAAVITSSCGFFGVTRENKKLVYAFYGASVIRFFYIGFKFFEFSMNKDEFVMDSALFTFIVSGKRLSYDSILTELASFCVVIRVLAIIWVILYVKNFDKGLKDLHKVREKNTHRLSIYEDESFQRLIS